MNLLTNSRNKAYRNCPKLHDLTYVQGWRPTKQADALNFGSAAHLGLEHIWQMAEVPERLLDDDFEEAKCQALLAGYKARWSADDGEQYSTIAVEMEFALPLIHPVLGTEHPEWTLAGKIDLLCQRISDGAYVLGEHKTSAEDISLGSHYWRRLDLDTQILLYLHAMERLGYPCRSVLYDVLAKPRQRPKKGETARAYQARIMADIAGEPSAYYARCELVRTQKQIDAALLDAWDWCERMSADMKMGWAPRNVDHCFKYGRPCHFFDYCSGLKSLEEIGMAKAVNTHAELSLACNQKETA